MHTGNNKCLYILLSQIYKINNFSTKYLPNFDGQPTIMVKCDHFFVFFFTEQDDFCELNI